jgi:hypothetical protein
MTLYNHPPANASKDTDEIVVDNKEVTSQRACRVETAALEVSRPYHRAAVRPTFAEPIVAKIKLRVTAGFT